MATGTHRHRKPTQNTHGTYRKCQSLHCESGGVRGWSSWLGRGPVQVECMIIEDWKVRQNKIVEDKKKEPEYNH